MEIKAARLDAHQALIERAMRDVCKPPSSVHFMEARSEAGKLHIRIARLGSVTDKQRQVTGDMGRSENVFALPFPDANGRAVFWIGAHEIWQFTGKAKRLAFITCGLRLYSAAADENIDQLLRLEWVGRHSDGTYAGDHAGHPHWHIDPAALGGREVKQLLAERRLEQPSSGDLIETFTPEQVLGGGTRSPSSTLVYGWLTKIHLPAQAEWMHTAWDGSGKPGPHQCDPENLSALGRWWDGAIRYLETELRSRVL